MLIRKANILDLKQIKNLYTIARRHMIEEGNLTQWADEEMFIKETENFIKQECLYVVIVKDEIVGIYALIYGIDETYNVIDGKWTNDDVYVTIHKMAVKYYRKGIASKMLEHITKEIKLKNISNIRIDTHKDNISMNKFLLNYDFIYCGVISIKNDFNNVDSLRNAYLKIV